MTESTVFKVCNDYSLVDFLLAIVVQFLLACKIALHGVFHTKPHRSEIASLFDYS